VRHAFSHRPAGGIIAQRPALVRDFIDELVDTRLSVIELRDDVRELPVHGPEMKSRRARVNLWSAIADRSAVSEFTASTAPEE
jgi:hypothetical protein